MSEAGARYLAERTRDPRAAFSPQTADQIKGTLRLLSDFTGDARLDEIEREDAADFLDALGRLHRHYGRHRDAKALSLNELLRQYPAAGGSC